MHSELARIYLIRSSLYGSKLTNSTRRFRYIDWLASWLRRSGLLHTGQLKCRLFSFTTTVKCPLKQSLQSVSVHPGMATICGIRATAASHVGGDSKTL